MPESQLYYWTPPNHCLGPLTSYSSSSLHIKLLSDYPKILLNLPVNLYFRGAVNDFKEYIIIIKLQCVVLDLF